MNWGNSMYDLILKNCKIVNENKIIESDIAIKNNRIELIQASIDSESKKIVDVDGKYVLPGLIDDQVHFREPGLTHKGDIATESRAGLAGGVTSYFEMPNVNPTTTTNENLSKKFDIASTKSRSNYSFHLGASNTNIEEIKRVDINQAAALKVFMGASTGEMLVDSLDALDDIFNYSPLIVVTHCEDQTTVKNNEKLFLEKYGDDLSAQHHHLIRDVESCYLSSSLAVGLAKKYDSDLHVFHLTTEKEMELFTPGAVNGKKITRQRELIYILLNKPKDYITTTDDPQKRKTVLDIIGKATQERIYPVGRLDRNTTGVLLLTNDGELAQQLTHPGNQIRKVYQVTLDKPLEKADFEQILKGVVLEDGPASVDVLAYTDPRDKRNVGIEIHSGRNRIVRRIFEHAGYDVKNLDRVLFAGLTKKNVDRGKWRYLNEKEVRTLKHFSKGK